MRYDGGMDQQPKNRVWPAACRHVREGKLPEVERLILATVEPHDDDWRYTKGPDSVQLCPLCAGMLWGYFSKECE